jgi:DNA-binding NarL/FixJ family response regulator
VAIVDDDALFREGLAAILIGAGIPVTGTYPGGEAAFPGMTRHPPDVILLDVMLDGAPVGLDLVSRFLGLGPPAPAVMLVSSFAPPYLVELARARGARGYLRKAVDAGTLLAAIRVVTEGGEMFPATSVPQTGPRPPTDREIGIIEAVAAGLASKEIGPKLGIEARTVESHLSRMLERYSVESRTELVVLAARMGWITELPTGD